MCVGTNLAERVIEVRVVGARADASLGGLELHVGTERAVRRLRARALETAVRTGGADLVVGVKGIVALVHALAVLNGSLTGRPAGVRGGRRRHAAAARSAGCLRRILRRAALRGKRTETGARALRVAHLAHLVHIVTCKKKKERKEEREKKEEKKRRERRERLEKKEKGEEGRGQKSQNMLDKRRKKPSTAPSSFLSGMFVLI